MHMWDISSLVFRVGVMKIVFKHPAVCLALGLPIIGEPLSESIDRDNINDFCRVY